jgi:hypothetical protein
MPDTATSIRAGTGQATLSATPGSPVTVCSGTPTATASIRPITSMAVALSMAGAVTTEDIAAAMAITAVIQAEGDTPDTVVILAGEASPAEEVRGMPPAEASTEEAVVLKVEEVAASMAVAEAEAIPMVAAAVVTANSTLT